MRRDSQSSSIPTPHLNQGLGTLKPRYHTGGTYSQNRLPETSDLRNATWKIPELIGISKLQVTMHWIKEVEIVKSIDDLMTSQLITGRKDFLDYEMLDAKIASALKKIITSVHFRRRASVEEQRAQKDDRFLQGRQIDFVSCEYFRATGAYEAVQGL